MRTLDSVRALRALLLFFALAPGGVLHAQRAAFEVDGRVIDAASAPVAALTVVMHRVSAAGTGALVATDTTAADGTFRLIAPPSADTASEAVYFVAVRYDSELYIGEAFRPPVPADAEYVLQVGVPGTSATAMLQSGASAPAATRRRSPVWVWPLLTAGLLAITLAAVYTLTRNRTPEYRRTLLLEIAKLDEAQAAEGSADAGAYHARRAELIARIAAAARS